MSGRQNNRDAREARIKDLMVRAQRLLTRAKKAKTQIARLKAKPKPGR